MSTKREIEYVQIDPGKPGLNQRLLMLRIPVLWAFLGVGDDGDEGMAAFFSPQMGWMPMVAADEKQLDALREIARGIAASGRVLRLVRFGCREDGEEFRP